MENLTEMLESIKNGDSKKKLSKTLFWAAIICFAPGLVVCTIMTLIAIIATLLKYSIPAWAVIIIIAGFCVMTKKIKKKKHVAD